MATYRIERVKDSKEVALYIDNSLQFDTRDEYLYHESLFLPPAALASIRNQTDLEGLILGGGDGLGLREVLKYAQMKHVDLVDYSPEMIQLAKHELRPFNKSSLLDPRVGLHIEEASYFLKSSKSRYDLIVADFTFPQDLAGCSLFTKDFFDHLVGRLKNKGVIALNTFSPEHSPEAYWSVYRTLCASKLHPKPLQIHIPSFVHHEYGKWGFFLASPQPIMNHEIQKILFPEDHRFISKEIFLKSMSFESSLAAHGLNFGRIIHKPEDLRALLNVSGIFSPLGGDSIDFSKDMLPVEIWKYFANHPEYVFFSMSAYWKERVLNILEELDWDELLKSQEIKALLTRESVHRVLLALIAVIIVTNMLCPDNAYAKGYSGYHGGSYHRNYGNSYQSTENMIRLLATVPATPFHNQIWLTSLNVPNMKGEAFPKASLPTGPVDVTLDKPQEAFFMLNDLTYVTREGDLFQQGPQTSFYGKIASDRFTLYRKGDPSSMLELSLDQELINALERNIETHSKALDKTIKQFEQWLNWSGSTEVIVKEIFDEKRELNKLKELREVFKKVSQNTYSVSLGTEFDEPSLRLAPSIRLTTEGNIVMKTADGFWKDYVYYQFNASGKREVLASSPLLNILVVELLKAKVQTLRNNDPLKGLIQSRLGST